MDTCPMKLSSISSSARPRKILQFYALPIFFTCGTLYLITAWSRVLLEKLTRLQLVKKFPVFYGIRRSVTAVKSARRLSLS
jgi:hypothetical protein